MRTRSFAISIFSAILGLCFLNNVAVADVASVDCSKLNGSITVRGYGLVKALPDEATIDVTAKALEKDVKEARSICEKNTASFIKALEALGVKKKDLESESISISPRYSYDPKKNKQKLEGYIALRNIKIRTQDFSILGAITTAAVEAGIDEINGISYAIKDESSLQKQADQKAIENALSQAQALADGFKVKLLKPCQLSFENRNQRGIVLHAAKAMTLNAVSASPENPSYEPSESEVDSYVNAVFAFE